MKITYEASIRDFRAWSGAVDTQEAIIKADKADLFDALMDDMYPDGMGATEYNDFLWFESDYIGELLEMRTEAVINEEIEELESKLEDLECDLEDDPEDDDIKAEIAEVKAEIEELKAETPEI